MILVAQCLLLVWLGYLWARVRSLARSYECERASVLYHDLSRAHPDHDQRMYLIGRAIGVIDGDLIYLGRSPEHVAKDVIK